MKICLKIITTKPVIVQLRRSGAHSLRCQIFWRCNFFFDFFRGFIGKKVFEQSGLPYP